MDRQGKGSRRAPRRRRPLRPALFLLGVMAERLDDIEAFLKKLERKMEKIMTDQDKVNEFVARIDAAVAGIRGDIEELKSAHPAVDFSALEERVSGLEALDAENPAPEPEPAPEEPQP